METSPHVPASEVIVATDRVLELSKARFREARGDEVDWLAWEKLGAMRIEE